MGFGVEQFPLKVLHLRDQIQIGLSLAEKLMERRCLMLCTDKNQRDSLSGMMRRSLQDASQRFSGNDAQKTHHIGYIDMAKMGRLAQPEVDEAATWANKLLNQSPDYSNVR